MMLRTLLSGKIHRATVTGADVNYVGSLTVDTLLLEAAGILPFEQVHIADVTNGQRLETYTIPGPRGSGTVQVNGAAAHLVNVGDLIIVMSYVQAPDPTPAEWRPRVVLVDANNRVVEVVDPREMSKAPA